VLSFFLFSDSLFSPEVIDRLWSVTLPLLAGRSMFFIMGGIFLPPSRWAQLSLFSPVVVFLLANVASFY